MTLFSTILSEHIKTKNIRIHQLAQYCGVDRSNMYKIINGKRNPGSEELVQKIADFMRLTPTERRELLEAYEITITGYETYYRRKNVQDFISNFSMRKEETFDSSPYFSSTLDYSQFTDTLSINGKTKLNHNVPYTESWP